MPVLEETIKLFQDWYDHLPVHKASGGVAKGTICAALVVLDSLKNDFILDINSHLAAGGAQIKGASGAAVARILERFGETRPFSKEGGRTNRGGPGDIKKMLKALNKSRIKEVSEEERVIILEQLQLFLVEKVRDYHNRQRIHFVFDPSKTIRQLVSDILEVAKETGKEGPVAQHLVGAKLQLRFPNEKISNESYSTADDQLGRPGDFFVGSTVFHITVAPMPPVFDKCIKNLEEGYRAFLLVPDRQLSGSRYDTDNKAKGKIAVESIESFVGQNIEELATFNGNQLIKGFRGLIDTYNSRVDQAELDKSLLIEVPKNLS